MKVLVTGVSGQLGYDVVKELNKRGHIAVGVDKRDFDITDKKAVDTFIKQVCPEAVIHCAGYTAVDAAEENVALCRKINVQGTENIALVCKAINAKMVYISTDYVFNGKKEMPYEVNDIPNPLNVYGQSKLDGENIVKILAEKYFVVRTSWVFGKNGNNFVKTMLRLGKEKERLTVVNDQVGSPTYTVDLAKLLGDIIITDKYGIYHATNEGFCSWAKFASEIMQKAKLECKIIPVTSNEYKTKAQRPLNSRLSKKSLDNNGFARLPMWQDALGRYFNECELF